MTLLKSIFASDRLSRIRLTIHFSPSSGDKFNRLDKSLQISLILKDAVLDINNLMNPTIRYGNQMSCTLNKLICQTRQEEITFQHRLNLHQLFLCQIKIKIHIQSINKLSNRIRVLICFLLYNFDEFTDLFVVIV